MTTGEPTVVELRVHGFSGTTAESLLDAVAAVDVAGDGVGRVVRPADQLRRPVPGPPLVAGGRQVPRIVEGYVWGGMTSGGWAKATWALLLPFALSNVAHWMLPPLPSDTGPGRTIGLLLRSMLRTVSLLLTCLLIGQFTLLSLDLVAAQCLAPGTDCLAGVVPRWARELPQLRAAAGLLPVLALVWLLHRLSGTDWPAPDPGPGPAPGAAPPGVASWLPATPLAGDPDTPTLRALHTMAGLGTAALLALGGPYGPVAGLGGPWLVALGLLAVAAAGAVLLDDPTGAATERGGAWVRAVLGRWQRRILLATGGALLLATATVLPLPPGPLPGADDTLEWLSALLTVLCGALAALLVPAARLARPAWTALPRGMRPWAGGWAAAPVVALAVLIGAGFGAGMALTLRRMLGAPQLELPAGYTAVTLVWGAAAAVLAAGVLLAGLALAYRQWRLARGSAAPPVEVPLLHPPPARHAAVASAWWRADLMRFQAYRAVIAVTGTLVLLVGAVWAVHLASIELPAWTRTISAFGVTALAALAGGVLGAVYRAARQPDAARQLGQLWDLASFWPREGHPAVPPAYPLKVVPELVRRAREHLADPSARLVLVGQGQGSLLTAMAAARLLTELPPADRDRVGLVTAGSQLQWAYPRAFPAVVPASCLAELSRALGGRWRALCRGTDPIGGGVTTWHRHAVGGILHGSGLRADGTSGPLPPAAASPSGALVLGGDHWLPDPARDPVPGRRWHPGTLGHLDYQADPEWDRAVAMAAGIAGGAPTGNGLPDPLHAVPPLGP